MEMAIVEANRTDKAAAKPCPALWPAHGTLHCRELVRLQHPLASFSVLHLVLAACLAAVLPAEGDDIHMQMKAQLQAHAPMASPAPEGCQEFWQHMLPARLPSLPLGKGGSCQTKCADLEINDSPAKPITQLCSPLSMLSRGGQKGQWLCQHYGKGSFLLD